MPSYLSSIHAFATLILSAAAAPTLSGAVPSAVLASCSAAMDGQLPSPSPPGFNFSGNVRRYYIAAEEVEWDYAPTGWDNWLGVPLNISPRAAMYSQYGTKWLKALYRGYTDSTFSQLSIQPPWQGTQGPTIRSEVGDLIEIMFVNNLSKNYATMHSMGLAYTKVSEGADYPDNTVPGENVVLSQSDAVPPIENGVPPQGCVVYKWLADEIAGPNFGEPAKTHSYHSYVAMQQDADAGLIGPQIVYASGQMKATMENYREIPLLYMIYDESDSWLSAENKAALGSKSQPQKRQGGPPDGGSPLDFGGFSGSQPGDASRSSYNIGGPLTGSSSPSPGAFTSAQQSDTPSSSSNTGGPPTASSSSAAGGFSGASQGGGYGSIDTNKLYSGNYSVWHPQVVNLAGAGQFEGAPSFYTMNGYIFANNPTYEMCLDDKVIWYVNAYGSMSHVFHLHGNGVNYNGGWYPAVSINDGVGKTLYMDAVGHGKWQVICHVNYHQTLGMVSNYEVYPAGQCPLPPLASKATES